MYAIGKFGHETPFSSAVFLNDIQSAKILLNYGMDLNFIHPDGKRPLDEAIQQCTHSEMISLLIQHGAKFKKTNAETLKIRCKKVPYLALFEELLEKSTETEDVNSTRNE